VILEGITRIDADGRSRTEDARVGDGGERIPAAGLLLLPGLVDLHAHLREPGFEDSETIATGAAAALRGGFTTLCAMANTEPAIDSPGLVAELALRAKAARGARVLPVAAITRGRKGRELADLMELAAAGAVAFSDDGDPVDDARLFRSALEYARSAGRPVLEHPQDRALSARGVMHEGAVSADLGLPGMPAAAEEAAVARAVAVARLVGGRLHLQHISTAGSLDLVRRAKADGLSVTCEVTPHHLALTDEWVAGSRRLVWETEDRRASPYDSTTKVNPPLRSAADVRALWAGLADGTVDAIATDHAPHASVRKDVEYAEAAFGISGLETALAVLLMAVEAGMGELGTVVRALTSGPARVLGHDLDAEDLIVVDPRLEWKVTPDALASKGKNTPLLGMPLRGRVVAACVGGDLRYRHEALKERHAEAIARR
jgi:dihydroorotase